MTESLTIYMEFTLKSATWYDETQRREYKDFFEDHKRDYMYYMYVHVRSVPWVIELAGKKK